MLKTCLVSSFPISPLNMTVIFTKSHSSHAIDRSIKKHRETQTSFFQFPFINMIFLVSQVDYSMLSFKLLMERPYTYIIMMVLTLERESRKDITDKDLIVIGDGCRVKKLILLHLETQYLLQATMLHDPVYSYLGVSVEQF